jgi:hypothetical protein
MLSIPGLAEDKHDRQAQPAGRKSGALPTINTTAACDALHVDDFARYPE